MKRYTEYKSSVASSFGKIPTHWDEIKTKFLFRFGRGLSISRENMSDEGIPCIHYGDIHGNYGFEIDPAKAEIGRVDESFLKSSPQAVVVYGDFLFVGSSEDVEGSGNFTFVNADVSAIAGSDTITLHAKNPLEYRYIAYLFDSIAYREQIRTKVYGVKVFHPTQAMIKNAFAVLPTVKEQTAITAYLDHRTHQIDTLLADLQSQAKMLGTYKRELIAEAVTKGLDKSAAIKDSGVDWIGEIPAHWDVKRIGILYSERSMKVNDEDFAPLSVTMQGILPQLEHVAKTDNNTNRKLVRQGDFVINSRSDRRGACGISPLDGSVSVISIVLRPLITINNRYFSLFFRTEKFADEFYKLGYGIVNDLWSTKWTQMKRITVVVPPLDEQAAIAEHLEKRISRIEGLIANITAQIEKLKQYRQIVIHDAVTGKIKVTEG